METPGWLTCSNMNCKSKKSFREDLAKGDIICTACGRVAAEKTIDMGSEWRNFSDSGENKSRAENVDDVVDKLTTQITVTKGDSKHNAMTRMQQQISGNEQKALTQAVTKINDYAEQMELKDDVRKRAKALYKQFDQKKTRKIRGSNSDAIILAVLYLACKEYNVSRTFKELSKETAIKEQDIKKMYLILTKFLAGTTRATPVSPHELVIRICSNLSLPANIKGIGEQIAKNVASRLEGKSPSSIAAASIYMAVKRKNITNVTEKEIAKAASISASTVKNIYKDMEPWEEDIYPKISD